ncbi:MAG: DUF3043 domain-containing protein [Actinomycetota bacterium]|nr:DUF3043 domain-containing protein [Actinomycetota bacterium]
MFGRRSKTDETPADRSAAADGTPLAGKGRPTPSRRQAEAERKRRMTPPRTRKEANRVMRQRRAQERVKAQAALRSGDERYLPARDQGKVRRFARDFVDARFNVAEFLLPLLIVILVLGVVGNPGLQGLLWVMTIVSTATDTFYLVYRTKRELKRRFPDDVTKGAVLYAVLRSSQLRRLRLPKPQVERGATLPERY